MAYHFVVNLMEMNFTDFVNYIFAFKSNKSEASVSIGLFVKHEHGVFNLEVKITFHQVEFSYFFIFVENLIKIPSSLSTLYFKLQIQFSIWTEEEVNLAAFLKDWEMEHILV